ncbi:hypothetical protein MUG91_G8n42 [Manis pentadactyla]|nr:hypothetical protein MUG91_G8n42 [Manis pentadactyla]
MDFKIEHQQDNLIFELRLVQLPSASFASDSAGQDVLPPRKEDPSKVSDFPGPLPSEPLSPSGGGGGTGEPRLQA